MKNDENLPDLDEMIRSLTSTPEFRAKENEVNQILSKMQERKKKVRKFFAYGAVSLCGIALGTLLILYDSEPKKEVEGRVPAPSQVVISEPSGYLDYYKSQLEKISSAGLSQSNIWAFKNILNDVEWEKANYPFNPAPKLDQLASLANSIIESKIGQLDAKYQELLSHRLSKSAGLAECDKELSAAKNIIGEYDVLAQFRDCRGRITEIQKTIEEIRQAKESVSMQIKQTDDTKRLQDGKSMEELTVLYHGLGCIGFFPAINIPDLESLAEITSKLNDFKFNRNNSDLQEMYNKAIDRFSDKLAIVGKYLGNEIVVYEKIVSTSYSERVAFFGNSRYSPDYLDKLASCLKGTPLNKDVTSLQDKVKGFEQSVARETKELIEKDARQLTDYKVKLDNFVVPENINASAMANFMGISNSINEMKKNYPLYTGVVNSDDASIKLNYLLLENVDKAYNSRKDDILKELTSRFTDISKFYGKFKAKGKIAPESITGYSSKLEEIKNIKEVYGILGEQDNVRSASQLFDDMQSFLIKSQGGKR